MGGTEMIKTLFLDIGGVLLTNGWGHESRKLAAEKFDLDREAMQSRHVIVVEAFELGKLTLDEYLDRVIFYEPRDFSKDEFRRFIFSQSQPFPDMIGLIKLVKNRYHLKVVAVSNESRELNAYRIEKYGLNEFIDFFVSSSYVHIRKPDINIYKLALDLAQSPSEKTLCIDDLCEFVKVAGSLGIKGICHSNYEKTCEKLNELGIETAS